MTFPFTVSEAELLQEFSCQYGSAARSKKTYPVGMRVQLREWNNGSFDLLDGMYQVKRGAVEGVDFRKAIE